MNDDTSPEAKRQRRMEHGELLCLRNKAAQLQQEKEVLEERLREEAEEKRRLRDEYEVKLRHEQTKHRSELDALESDRCAEMINYESMMQLNETTASINRKLNRTLAEPLRQRAAAAASVSIVDVTLLNTTITVTQATTAVRTHLPPLPPAVMAAPKTRKQSTGDGGWVTNESYYKTPNNLQNASFRSKKPINADVPLLLNRPSTSTRSFYDSVVNKTMDVQHSQPQQQQTRAVSSSRPKAKAVRSPAPALMVHPDDFTPPRSTPTQSRLPPPSARAELRPPAVVLPPNGTLAGASASTSSSVVSIEQDHDDDDDSFEGQLRAQKDIDLWRRTQYTVPDSYLAPLEQRQRMNAMLAVCQAKMHACVNGAHMNGAHTNGALTTQTNR